MHHPRATLDLRQQRQAQLLQDVKAMQQESDGGGGLGGEAVAIEAN